jgi:hypothetical protein
MLSLGQIGGFIVRLPWGLPIVFIRLPMEMVAGISPLILSKILMDPIYQQLLAFKSRI